MALIRTGSSADVFKPYYADPNESNPYVEIQSGVAFNLDSTSTCNGIMVLNNKASATTFTSLTAGRSYAVLRKSGNTYSYDLDQTATTISNPGEVVLLETYGKLTGLTVTLQ